MPPEGNVDKSDDDEEQFEDSFSTPPEEEEKEEPPQEQASSLEDKRCSKEALPPLSPIASMVPSFVHTGLQRKASFTELKYWIALSLSLDGRDKITKVLQYASRFLGWWFLSKVNPRDTSIAHGRRFTSLYKSLGSSRKAFRLGRSINEIHKISSMGLLGLLFWHLKQHYVEDSRKAVEGDQNNEGRDENLETKSINEPSKTTTRPSSAGVSSPRVSRSIRTTLTPNFNSISYRILSFVSSSFDAVFPSNDESRVGWWKVIGSALKTIGLLGYWLGDNVNFLTSSGALDNYSLSEKDRLARRKRWQDVTSKKANQFYFFATMIGLATNSYAYNRFQLKNAIAHGQQRIDDDSSKKTEREEDKDRVRELRMTQQKQEQKQFDLFLAMLKSCMDVVVFSNNPGIDLHKKWRGRKNHEGLHCLCGLISAGTSLYNNFPDAKI